MKTLRSIAPLAAFVLALVGMLGSLFAQHLGLQPCVLCWWQRVFLYPLVFLIPVGILRRDRGLWLYVVPLAVLGALTALYQTLLYYAIIPEALAPCAVGVPCTQALPTYLGLNLITGSLLTFLAIGILMLISRTADQS